MQPLFRHVPPNALCSITATLSPCSAAYAEMCSPEPAPITITSYLFCISILCSVYFINVVGGSIQSAGMLYNCRPQCRLYQQMAGREREWLSTTPAAGRP